MAAADPTSENPVLAVVTRSGRIESRHRGAAVVVHDGQVVWSLGDVERPVYARSATKPLQALPFLERGLHERLGLSAAEIAIMCASHSAAPAHVAVVRSLLARASLHEDMLGCGPHAPYDKASRLALLAAGQRPAKVHNNCSGKHAGFLALAQACGDDLARYLEPQSRAQQEVLAAVSSMVGGAPLQVGVDGCGAPTFWLPLVGLAQAFARLANPDALDAVRGAACRTILAAVGREPFFLEGEGELCTAIVRELPGRCFAKNGAEGVYAVALTADPARRRFPGPLGIAVKIDDGAQRACAPVVLECMRRLGVFATDALPTSLHAFHVPPVFNTQKLHVGAIESVAAWPA